jgi:hypothetical protein
VLARDGGGKQYNIEMQVRRYDAWGQRSVYYLARLLGQQLQAGGDYRHLKAVVGIHLLDFDWVRPSHNVNCVRRQAPWDDEKLRNTRKARKGYPGKSCSRSRAFESSVLVSRSTKRRETAFWKRYIRSVWLKSWTSKRFHSKKSLDFDSSTKGGR